MNFRYVCALCNSKHGHLLTDHFFMAKAFRILPCSFLEKQHIIVTCSHLQSGAQSCLLLTVAVPA